MGFKAKRRIFKLEFEDPELEGLEVRAASVDAATFYELVDLFDSAKADKSNADLARQLVPEFSKVLRSWNLEDEDDQPIPATAEGLLSQELDFVITIIGAWMDALAGVSAPLDQPSSDGPTSLVESIPMETLSENPQSSLMPA